MDELFERNISGIIGSDQVATWPHSNISEDNTQFTIEISAPGFEKNSFEIIVNSDKLIVETTIKNEEKQADNPIKWLRKEFSSDHFKRTFKLPEKADIQHVNAIYEHGILKIKIAKKTSDTEYQPLKVVVN